jgi:GNAT superfamily N-acetyltransferase
MYQVNRILVIHAREYLDLLKRIDCDTDYMLYKKGERKVKVDDVVGHIHSISVKKNSLLLGYWDEKGKLVGYLGLYGGKQERVKGVCTLSMGVDREYWGKGICSMLWKHAYEWACFMKMRKIELSVNANNIKAKNIYLHWGFSNCGYWSKRIEGEYGELIGEYLMEFIL